ncbi:dimethylargininase [Nocardiopsis ansamitocini]|nr:dimethylargininase [Nocardiopsis ansamitocini]
MSPTSLLVETPDRIAVARHYVMCPPDYFDVQYAINAWMDPGIPVDRGLAAAQWNGLRDAYLGLGHRVSLLEPLSGLPDMVFTANGATIVDGVAYEARFRHPERAPETLAHRAWLAGGVARAVQASAVNEGEGDFLVTERCILAGTGFRTEPAAHREVQELFGRPVVSLQLVDPRFYHLDTAIAVLDDGRASDRPDIAYFPGAFTPEGRAALTGLFPDALAVGEEDAAVLGLNAVGDGRNVVLPVQAGGLVADLRERGYHPVLVDTSELAKAGGGPKCCTLEVREPLSR